MSIAGNGHKLILLVVYRPGSAMITQSFYDEFEDTVCAVISMNQNFVIIGDFNVHVDDMSDAHGTRLRCLFDAYGLHQHVQSSTHDHGHTLDLVVTADTTLVFDLQVHEMHKLSDHRCIDFDLPYSVMQKCTRTVITRNWQNFDTDIFINEVANSELVTTMSDDVNYLFDLYNTTLMTLIDKHAAQRRVMRWQQQCAPWYDAECHNVKREVRRLESIFRRRRFPRCHLEWSAAVSRHHQLLGSKQRSFWSGRVLESAGDSRAYGRHSRVS